MCPVYSVRFFTCDSALAIKFSIPRPIIQGDLGDGDLHGGQQFAPLMSIEIPVPEGWTIRPQRQATSLSSQLVFDSLHQADKKET